MLPPLLPKPCRVQREPDPTLQFNNTVTDVELLDRPLRSPLKVLDRRPQGYRSTDRDTRLIGGDTA